MTRMEEFDALRQELAEMPAAAEGTVARAVRRNRRRRLLWQPLSAAAAVFLCFVALVNLFPTVAYACSKVPILADLAEAVSFSPSLTRAVENDYVQRVDQTVTDGDVTATMEYLIVDQKQVILYFRLDSPVYEQLAAMPDARLMDGTEAHANMVGSAYYRENGELLSATINFLDDTSVPEQLRVVLNVRAGDSRDVVASPEFVLDIDPTFTAQGRVIELNRTVDLDGQSFTLTTMEVYPTHIRFHVEEDPDNTAWLKTLRFYLEMPDGTRVDAGSSSGIAATGQTYYAESTYFARADPDKLIITGAGFLDKEAEPVWVDLTTLETGPLPCDGELIGFEDRLADGENEQVLLFRFRGVIYGQMFSMDYTDPEGNTWYSSRYGVSTNEEEDSCDQFFYLEDYPYDTVCLQLTYTGSWTPDPPVTIPLGTA